MFDLISIALLAGTLLAPQNEQLWTHHLIQHYGTKYGVPLNTAYTIANCESKLRNIPSDYHETEDSFGPFQLQSEFWIRNAKRFGLNPNPKMRYSIEANVHLAMLVMAKDGVGAWYRCGVDNGLITRK